MIQEKLEAGGQKTVWFNAWKYDGKEVLWNALIQTIFFTMQIDPDLTKKAKGKETKKRIADMAKGLATYAAKVAVRFIPGKFIEEQDIDKVAEIISPSDATSPQFAFVNRFESDFDDLLREYLGANSKLTIFIDDLDRCLPESAIVVLESMKLYLDRARCVFVIGAESSIIEEGIRQRYSNSRLSARDYIEKIVQLPFMMQRSGSTEAIRLISADDDFYSDAQVQLMIVEATGCNPRRMKRFANTLSILETLNGKLDLASKRKLAKILLIQMRFPDLYFELLKDPGTLAKLVTTQNLAEIKRKEELEKADKSFVALYSNTDLWRFLKSTKDIGLTDREVERWLEVTKGTAV
jgi:predicted KAP-like P-loop ATPase